MPSITHNNIMEPFVNELSYNRKTHSKTTLFNYIQTTIIRYNLQNTVITLYKFYIVYKHYKTRPALYGWSFSHHAKVEVNKI